MKAVKESKRLVALLAVLFLMSGVFSVIAAASPEEAKRSGLVQNIVTDDETGISEIVRVQTPKIKKALFEQHRSEIISAKAETVSQTEDNIDIPIQDVSEIPAETSSEPETVPEEITEEPAVIEEYPAEPEYIPEEYVPEEYVPEPEYIPEEYVPEPEYIPEEYVPEPEYVAEEYVPESEYVAEEYVPEPEYVPEAPAEEPVYTEEPVPEVTAEPTPEAAAEPTLTYLGNFMLTAYCPCSACCGAYATGYTASGTLATEGVTVAMGGVDFGTRISINGHIYTVEDRGTGYGHVDIFFADHGSALAFGLQYADVYLVE